MPSLDNLIVRITAECEAEAGRIKDAANAEAQAILSKAAEETEALKKAAIDDATAQAAKIAERITLEKKLEVRDENLRARREVIDRVLDLALKRLGEMPKSQYLDFIKAGLDELKADGGELVANTAYGLTSRDISVPGVSVSDGRHVDGGFLLVKEGVEYNFTFDALLEYRRHELEAEIMGILWG